MQAYIVRSELAKFKRRGWAAYKKRKEFIEAMFGIVHNGVVVVSMFYPIEHTANYTGCYFEDEVYEDLAELAKEHHLKLVGTIHTHPGGNTCSHPSPIDVNHAVHNSQHELMFGTMHLFKKDRRSYSQVQWTCPWEPVEVRYINRKGEIR